MPVWTSRMFWTSTSSGRRWVETGPGPAVGLTPEVSCPPGGRGQHPQSPHGTQAHARTQEGAQSTQAEGGPGAGRDVRTRSTLGQERPRGSVSLPASAPAVPRAGGRLGVCVSLSGVWTSEGGWQEGPSHPARRWLGQELAASGRWLPADPSLRDHPLISPQGRTALRPWGLEEEGPAVAWSWPHTHGPAPAFCAPHPSPVTALVLCWDSGCK